MSSTLMQGHWDYSNNPLVGHGYSTSGGVVLAVQEMIDQSLIIYDGITCDGYYGPQTESAIKTWQRIKGLTQDGIVGPKTWYSFWEYLGNATQSGECKLFYDWKYVSSYSDPVTFVHFLTASEGCYAYDWWAFDGTEYGGNGYLTTRMNNVHYTNDDGT